MAYMGQQRDAGPIPAGWEDCPRHGDPIGRMIPMKVPLDMQRFGHRIMPHQEWTPTRALDTVLAHLAQRADRDPIYRIAMVVDLTNSRRYYNPREFTDKGVAYVKVPCVGRDASPTPAAVNMVVWELRRLLINWPHTYVLVHCTHGFNRTGYVITAALMRFQALTGFSVERGVRHFAEVRPPGIYKDQYISDLFRYHNEVRPKVAATPQLPHWKLESPRQGEEDDDDVGGGAAAAAATPAEAAQLHHDDAFGEVIAEGEEAHLRGVVYRALVDQDCMMQGAPFSADADMAALRPGQSVRFPGSQPVSLDRTNMDLIHRHRYWVTWKADGTRYMLLLCQWGAYMVDRSFRVTRVQMRFPTARPKGKPAAYPVGPCHVLTLLDGEMVVDDVDGQGQRRRFLAYDIMVLNKEGVMDMPFKERFALIEREVEVPRRIEAAWVKDHAARHPDAKFVYEYDWEPFSLRRKQFWPLTRARKLLSSFTNMLSHESDGLILQPWEDPYIARTCNTLLKWKYPHMNSVDFKYIEPIGEGPQLQLLHPAARGSYTLKTLPNARVRFDGAQAEAYVGRIIECAFDPETKEWVFMRERTDKDTPNAYHVFQKVWSSIQDNITEGDILGAFDEALAAPLYAPDVQALQQQEQQKQQQQPQPQHAGAQHPHHHHPAQQPPPPLSQQAAEQQQQQHAPGSRHHDPSDPGGGWQEGAAAGEAAGEGGAAPPPAAARGGEAAARGSDGGDGGGEDEEEAVEDGGGFAAFGEDGGGAEEYLEGGGGEEQDEDGDVDMGEEEGLQVAGDDEGEEGEGGADGDDYVVTEAF